MKLSQIAEKIAEKIRKQALKIAKIIGPFNGYDDLVKNFWGIEEENSITTWNNKIVYLMDMDTLSETLPELWKEILSQLRGHDKQELILKINEKSFKILELQSEGFNSFLFSNVDLKDLEDAMDVIFVKTK